MSLHRPFVWAIALLLLAGSAAADQSNPRWLPDAGPGCTNGQGAQAATRAHAACSAIIKAGTADSAALAAAHFYRAYAAVELQRLGEARADLEASIALKDDLPLVHSELSYVLIELGRFDDAIAAANHAIALSVDFPDPYGERATAHERRGDYAASLADFRLAIAKGQDGYSSHTSIATALAFLGDAKDARAELDRLTASGTPADAPVVHNINLLLASFSGDAAAACTDDNPTADGSFAETIISACTRAIADTRDAKTKAEFLRVRALVWLIARENKQFALADAEAGVRLDPQSPYVLSVRGMMRTQSNFIDLALVDADALIVMQPDESVHHYGRAAALVNLERYADALAAIERAITLSDIEVAAFYQVRGYCHDGLGQPDKALEDWRRAKALGGNNDALNEAIARAEAAAGGSKGQKN